jgi:hypothetical protein
VQADEPQVASGRLEFEEGARARGVVPLMAAERRTRHDGDRIALPLDGVIQPGQRRQPFEGEAVRRLLQNHDVWLQGGEEFGQQWHSLATTQADVVADDPERHAT